MVSWWTNLGPDRASTFCVNATADYKLADEMVTLVGQAGIAVTTVDSAGVLTQVLSFGAVTQDVCLGASSDASGGVTIGGEYVEGLSLGGPTLAAAADGGTNLFVAQFHRE